MQWDQSNQAGFTNGIPWIGVNQNKAEINVEIEESNPETVLNYFRRMISIRKTNEVLRIGTFELVETGESPLFIFQRSIEDEKWTIVLNFSSQSVKLPFDVTPGMQLVICNYGISRSGEVRPWEAVVYREKGEG
jgi:glycosidase